jgi:cysteine-rich repeat protein
MRACLPILLLAPLLACTELKESDVGYDAAAISTPAASDAAEGPVAQAGTETGTEAGTEAGTDAAAVLPGPTDGPPPDTAMLLPDANVMPDAAMLLPDAAVMPAVDAVSPQPDAAAAVCSGSMRRCNSSTPQVCGPGGQWQDSSPCQGATPICMGGTCVPIDHSGKWVGVTTQGYVFKMNVFANAVTDDEFDYVAQTAACTATGHTGTCFGTPEPISASGTFSKGPFGSPPVTYSITGTFTSATDATGSIQMTYAGPNCNKTQLLQWNARKVVCGDGMIQWPETCDDGNTTPNDGCAQICQLSATSEKEGNDSIATANGPYTSDVILTGSLPAPTDVDLFAVRNPYPGPVSIELETHGQTIGVCGVDTYLRVLDEHGTLLVEDDDGGRALSCSKIIYLLAAGQTVYVEVSVAIMGDTIAAYALHVLFQKP